MRKLIVFLLSVCAYAQTASYPGAVATNAQLPKAWNILKTKLVAAMSASDTSFTVANATGISANTQVTIGSEILWVCGTSGTTISVGKASCPNIDGRGTDTAHGGGAAVLHINGSLVQGFVTAWHTNALAAEVIAIQTALGVNLSALPSSVTTNSATYNFAAQTPGGSLVIGNNVITLTPCPLGVSGAHTVAANLPHLLYISAGTGTAEAAPITGGSCTSGATTGNVIVQTAATHTGAWTIQSASTGVQEAIYVAGATGAVQMASGTIPYYGTITVPSGYSTCVLGQGSWATRLSGQPTAAAVDGIVYDAVGGTGGTVCTGGYSIGPATGLNTAGVLVKIRYRADGFVNDIYTANGYDGFQMEYNARAIWSNISGGNKHYGLNITCAGVAYPSCVNQGTINGGHFTIGGNGGQNIHLEAPTSGLTIANMFLEGGSFATCTSVTISAVGTNPLNELSFNGNFLEGCNTGVLYTGNGATYLSKNATQFNGGRISAAQIGFAAQSFANGIFLNGVAISATGGTGTDRAVVIGGDAKDIGFFNCPISSDGDAGILTQGTVTDLDIIGNPFGQVAQPTSCLSFGGTTSKVNVRGNNFLGFGASAGCTGILAGTATSLSMTNNTGIDDAIPAVTAAATTAFPVNPTFTLTGATAVGAVTVPLAAGSKFTFVATNATPGAWTAGATIGNTFTPTQNVPVNCYWDATKIWCKP